jgi:hypothetical protein
VEEGLTNAYFPRPLGRGYDENILQFFPALPTPLRAWLFSETFVFSFEKKSRGHKPIENGRSNFSLATGASPWKKGQAKDFSATGSSPWLKGFISS